MKPIPSKSERHSGCEHQDSFVAIRTGMGVFIRDATHRRLIQGAAIQLDLSPLILDENLLSPEGLMKLELIVADWEAIPQIRSVMAEGGERVEGVVPALIAVLPSDSTGQASDGVLILPQAPALVATELSIILYSQRELHSRYQSAFEELHLNKKIFQSVTTGITVADATLPGLPLIYVNPAFEVMTGYKFEDIQGKNCRFLQRNERKQPGLTAVREALKDQKRVVAILRNYKKDGTPFWNELSLSPIFNIDGTLTHFVGIQMDITARVEAETALRESEKLLTAANLRLTLLSTTDPLTGLKNRRAFDERLASEIAAVKRTQKPSSLVLVDIDHFKVINDRYGHPAGDQVLCEVARLLESSVRSIDLTARYGGEEFAIFLHETTASDAMIWARRLYMLFAKCNWQFGAVTVSMGITEITASLEKLSHIVNRADQALYRAKHEGRAKALVYQA